MNNTKYYSEQNKEKTNIEEDTEFMKTNQAEHQRHNIYQPTFGTYEHREEMAMLAIVYVTKTSLLQADVI